MYVLRMNQLNSFFSFQSEISVTEWNDTHLNTGHAAPKPGPYESDLRYIITQS